MGQPSLLRLYPARWQPANLGGGGLPHTASAPHAAPQRHTAPDKGAQRYGPTPKGGP